MSTSPEPTPDNDSARSTAKSADGPKFYFVAVYPLVAGTALWVGGFFALMGLLYSEAGYAALFVLAAIAVIGGGHVWFRKILEGRNEPRPWQLPTVLSTAMALGTCVAVLPMSLNVDLPMPLPLVCMGLCLLGAGVFSQVGERHRFVSALAAVLGLALVLAALTWWVGVQEQEEQREELTQQVTAFQYPLAVLDAPGWVPSEMNVDQESRRASLTYEPADPSPELDGFRLKLWTKSIEDLEETGWTPLYSLCESDGGDHACEVYEGGEHGEIVVADMSTNSTDHLEARTEFTEGFAAELSTGMPTAEDEEPDIEFPDLDMVELAEQVRAAEPGEAEEVVSVVMD